MILELHNLREHILAMHVYTNTDKSSTSRVQSEMLWKGSAGYWGKTSLRHQGGGEIIPPNRWQSNPFLLLWAASSNGWFQWMVPGTVQRDGSWWYPVQWQCCAAGKAEIYDTCAKSASKKVWPIWPLPLRRREAVTHCSERELSACLALRHQPLALPCPARTFPCQMQGTCFGFQDTECPLMRDSDVSSWANSTKGGVRIYFARQVYSLCFKYIFCMS